MKIALTGGGTGGHVYPALAIADKIKEKEPDAEIYFLGCDHGIETTLVPKMGYDLTIFYARGMEVGGGFLFKIKEAILGLGGGIRGIFSARRALKKIGPDAVIGTGGFVSFPVIVAARMMGIPSYIHEQNTYPGRGNLMTAKFAKKIMLGFEEAGNIFPQKNKLIFIGNPIRESFIGVDRKAAREKLGISQDDFVVFSFGGSMGSNEINSVAMEYLRRINGKKGYTLVFATGEQFKDAIARQLAEEGIVPESNIKISSYIEDMAGHIGAANLIIGRAGALSIAEITACGRGAIYIPLSWAVNNHQYYNAKSIVDRGGGILVDEKAMDVIEVCDEIERLAEDRDRLEEMEKASLACSIPDAAEKIYMELKKLDG